MKSLRAYYFLEWLLPCVYKLSGMKLAALIFDSSNKYDVTRYNNIKDKK